MFVLGLLILFLIVNVVVGAILIVSAKRVANHVKNNPQAMQAVVENVFVPIFQNSLEESTDQAAPSDWRRKVDEDRTDG